MGFLGNLWQSVKKDSASQGYSRMQGNGVWVFVQCTKCQEKIRLRLRRTDELQRSEEKGAGAFFVNKTIMGKQCFTRIDAHFQFDATYRILKEHSELKNGKLISEREFEQEQDGSAQ